MSRITVVTLEFVGGSSNKFYRIFYGPTGPCFTQAGSQRNGRTGGQSWKWSGPEKAIEKLAEKHGKGYVEVETVEVEVPNWPNYQTVDEDDKDSIKAAIAKLEQFANSGTPTSAPVSAPATPGVPAQPAVDRIADLSAKILQAITVAGGDVVQGAVQRITVIEQAEPLMAEFRKLDSYLKTLDMVLGRS